MSFPTDDCARPRLTERADLEIAVNYLTEHGVDPDEIAIHLARLFYVDIDALNQVVATMEQPAAPHAQASDEAEQHGQEFRRVA